MKKAFVLATALTAALAVSPVLAATHSVPKNHQPLHHQINQRMKLNEQQKARMDKIVNAIKPQLRKQMMALSTNHEQINQLILKDKYNQSKLNRLANQQGRLIAKLITLRAKMRHQIYLILTPEQQRKAREMSKRPHPAA